MPDPQVLISTTRRFIFVAGLKTGSTAIERVFGAHAEIRLLETRFRKHMTLAEILSRFDWLFQDSDLKDYLIFGVMRDPIEWLVSFYNSHRRDDFKGTPLYTGNLSFSQFLETWARKHREQLAPQYRRFLDRRGRIGTNLIINHAKLRPGLDWVAGRLGLPRLDELPRENVSPAALTPKDLSAGEIRWVQHYFRADYIFMRRYCDTLIQNFSALPDLSEIGT